MDSAADLIRLQFVDKILAKLHIKERQSTFDVFDIGSNESEEILQSLWVAYYLKRPTLEETLAGNS